MNIIKTFARRAGRKLSDNKLDALDGMLPQYLFSAEKLSQLNYENIALESGFGKGENIVRQAIANPSTLYIGAEVFESGVASLLSLMKEFSITNILVWPKDADELLNDVPINSLSEFFLLFPDPWTKRRHAKRRFLQEWRILLILKKLKSGGVLYFASDISDYIDMVKELCTKLNLKHELSRDANFNNYQNTRYHEKAVREGRQVQFIKIYNLIY